MGTLRVVATPIGNLEDVTLRALRTLENAELVLAEDTRRTRVLLERHGLRAPLRSLHAHNEATREAEVLAALAAGTQVVLVSDAGTPLISDPGERLVAAALRAGHRVEAIPGASAVLAALVASGLRAVPFSFLGFPPRRAGARRELFERWRGREETLVFFESPQRLGSTLAELREVLGDRRAAVGRELTKMHEEVVRGPLSELAERFRTGARGEVTLVVEGAEAAGATRAQAGGELAEACLEALVAAGCSASETARRLAPALGIPRSELYTRAVAVRKRAR